MRTILAISLLCAVIPLTGVAGGKEITVNLTGLRTETGELLSVRPDCILVSLLPDLSDRDLEQRGTSVITLIPDSMIVSVQTEGHSYILAGMGIGLGAGFIVGAAATSGGSPTGDQLGDAFMKPMEMGVGGGIGALIGLIGGGLIGAAASTGEHTYVPDPRSGLFELRLKARYPDNEPEFLKRLFSTR